MAILQGHIPLKIGVVSFCPCPWYPLFVATQKTIVAKVVGNVDMHNPAKYGAKIRKFVFSKAKTLAHFP
jgi:hypothetical protein